MTCTEYLSNLDLFQTGIIICNSVAIYWLAKNGGCNESKNADKKSNNKDKAQPIKTVVQVAVTGSPIVRTANRYRGGSIVEGDKPRIRPDERQP